MSQTVADAVRERRQGRSAAGCAGATASSGAGSAARAAGSVGPFRSERAVRCDNCTDKDYRCAAPGASNRGPVRFGVRARGHVPLPRCSTRRPLVIVPGSGQGGRRSRRPTGGPRRGERIGHGRSADAVRRCLAPCALRRGALVSGPPSTGAQPEVRERRDMADKPVRADKATAVAELTERFRESNATLLTEYRGLTVAQLKQL